MTNDGSRLSLLEWFSTISCEKEEKRWWQHLRIVNTNGTMNQIHLTRNLSPNLTPKAVVHTENQGRRWCEKVTPL